MGLLKLHSHRVGHNTIYETSYPFCDHLDSSDTFHSPGQEAFVMCVLGTFASLSSLETFTRQASPLDFVELAKEFHVDFKTLTGLISWAIFALGVSNLFWMPTALCVGKRPVILTSMVVFLAGSVWSIKATSFNSLLGSRIVATLVLDP